MKIKKSLKIFGSLISLDTPRVMGILNVTPDSFYQGSRVRTEKEVLTQAGKMLEEGASFIDIGGYSSRPGADDVSLQEEIKRVVPMIKSLLKAFPDSRVSVDTFRSEVAHRALDSGAAIINDISGGQADDMMYQVVANWQCPYILMHMKGTPQTMQDHVSYDHVTRDVVSFFSEKVKQLRALGVADIIIDPGFGFAKDLRQNYQVLNDLSYLNVLGLPLLAGISRKSMIYKKLGINSQEALNGTTVLNSFALMKGASVLRVHDVKQAAEAIELYKEMTKD